jgi:hypothetical protein
VQARPVQERPVQAWRQPVQVQPVQAQVQPV